MIGIKKFMNIILKAFNCCPECYSDNLTTDFRKSEIYCSECGLVVKDNIPFNLNESIEHSKKEKQQYEELKQYKELKPIIIAYEKRQYLKQYGFKKNKIFF